MTRGDNQAPKDADQPPVVRPELIRWVAFDGVGTLLFPDPPVAVAYHRVGAQHGSLRTLEDVWQRFQERFRQSEFEDLGQTASATAAEPRPRLQTDEERELNRWRRIVLEVFDDVESPEACFEALYAHFGSPQAWRCHREAKGVFSKLKQAGLRLALASNFDARLERIADGLEDLSPIELRVISSLVGHRKPSPLFYQSLIDRSGCRAEEILMVGDDYENDVAGARNAGLQALHFTKNTTGRDDCISTLAELIDRLPTIETSME
jgi:putative hydrolase of the HAD superfamily